jgi:hypothetical protein
VLVVVLDCIELLGPLVRRAVQTLKTLFSFLDSVAESGLHYGSPVTSTR